MEFLPQLLQLDVTGGKLVSERVLEDNWNIAASASPIAHAGVRRFVGLRAVTSAAGMRSASPCRMSVARLVARDVLRKSSIHESTHTSVPIGEALAAMFQLSSRTRSLTSLPPVTSKL